MDETTHNLPDADRTTHFKMKLTAILYGVSSGLCFGFLCLGVTIIVGKLLEFLLK